MIDILLLMLFNALYIVGFYMACGNDMIFDRPARWIEMRIPYDLTKPLFNCPTCMATVHSILPFWLSYEISIETVLTYIIYVFALSTVSTLIVNKIEQ